MIIKINETRKQTISGKTINGFYLSAFLLAAATNTVILPTKYGTNTGFDASQVNLKATLKRDGKVKQLFNNNLGVLGQYNCLLSGGKNWLRGTDYVRPDVGVKHENLRSVFISLGGHHNLKGADEIEIECTIARSAFQSTVIDQSNSFIDINPAYSIGLETGIYSTHVEAIQANTTSDHFNLGDNVVKIAFLNFEDSAETVQLIKNLSIGSDRFDQSFNFADLIARNEMMYGKQPYHKPYPLTDPTLVHDSYTPGFPQSFILLNDEEIDTAVVDVTFDGTLINASKNFLVWTSFDSSLEILQRSMQMEEKHKIENLNKLPVTL